MLPNRPEHLETKETRAGVASLALILQIALFGPKTAFDIQQETFLVGRPGSVGCWKRLSSPRAETTRAKPMSIRMTPAGGENLAQEARRHGKGDQEVQGKAHKEWDAKDDLGDLPGVIMGGSGVQPGHFGVRFQFPASRKDHPFEYRDSITAQPF